MAENSSTVAQGASDTREVLSTWREVKKDVLDPIRSELVKRQTTPQLLQDLGEWASKAKDAQGRWLRPLLTAEKFEDHLRAKQGRFKPAGSSTARFGWARLLHALDIRPAGDIVSWELPTRNEDPTTSGRIDLDIDGEVVCHIINLYRIYFNPDPRPTFPPDPRQTFNPFPWEKNNAQPEIPSYVLSFGTLEVREVDRGFRMNFEPRSLDAIMRTKQPFGHQYPNESSVAYLKFQRKETISIYLDLTIPVGVSNTAMHMPSHLEKPLAERVQQLVYALQLVRPKPKPRGSLFQDEDTFDSTTAYLVTSAWLVNASRIYRRITSDPDEDSDLIGDIVSVLKPKALRTAYIRESFKGIDEWERCTRNLLSSQCMTQQESLSLVWSDKQGKSGGRATDKALDFLSDEFETVLDTFDGAPKGTLRHTLAQIRPEATYLLTTLDCKKLFNTPGVLLEFTPESRLWNSRARIEPY